MPTTAPTRISLSRSGGLNHLLAAAVSILLGAFGVIWAVHGHVGVAPGILGAVPRLAGVGLAWGTRIAADRLVVDDEAVTRIVGPRTVWRLRWAHMSAVRFGRARCAEEVPRATRSPVTRSGSPPHTAVADHREIAPALEPRPIDGILQPTFDVSLGLSPKVWDAVRDAVLRHAPSHLLPDSPRR